MDVQYTWGVMHLQELILFNLTYEEACRVVDECGHGYCTVEVPVSKHKPRKRKEPDYREVEVAEVKKHELKLVKAS